MSKGADKFRGLVAAGLERRSGAALLDHPLRDESSPVGAHIVAKYVPVNYLEPNPDQPRKIFQEARLQGLAESIKKKGINQPLIVQEIEPDKRYRIIAGERRWRAAQLAGKIRVPCIIKSANLSETDRDTISLIENVQREDLTPAEESAAFARLINDGMPRADVAALSGRTLADISKRLSIAKFLDVSRELLPIESLQLPSGKWIGIEHLYTASQESNTDTGIALIQQIIKHGLTIEDLRTQKAKGARHPIRSGSVTWDWKKIKRRLKGIRKSVHLDFMTELNKNNLKDSHIIEDLHKTEQALSSALHTIRSALGKSPKEGKGA